MKYLPWLGSFLLMFCIASGQQPEVQKEKSLLFINHTVQPKESLYSLARVYHLTAKDIATANKLKPDAPLQVAQVIRIPLLKQNFIQAEVKNMSGLRPVYHNIEQGDNLYQLSKRYNNVQLKVLSRWNGLSDNVVKQGQAIIIGYQKFSPAASGIPVQVVDDKSANTQGSPGTRDSQVIAASTKPAVKQDVPSSSPVKDEPVFTSPSGNFPQGYFASAYAASSAGNQKRLGGTAATFKSTSGWTDNKYYMLVTGIAENTIVKVTANGKTIYAKVLEKLPELRDNNGLVCRLSNAAFSALGINAAKAEVELVYSE